MKSVIFSYIPPISAVGPRFFQPQTVEVRHRTTAFDAIQESYYNHIKEYGETHQPKGFVVDPHQFLELVLYVHHLAHLNDPSSVPKISSDPVVWRGDMSIYPATAPLKEPIIIPDPRDAVMYSHINSTRRP